MYTTEEIKYQQYLVEDVAKDISSLNMSIARSFRELDYAPDEEVSNIFESIEQTKELLRSKQELLEKYSGLLNHMFQEKSIESLI